VAERVNNDVALRKSFDGQFSFLDPSKRLILVTGHRRENFGEGFEQICSALAEIAVKNPDVEIIYPVHLNPNVQEPVRRILGNSTQVHLIEPQASRIVEVLGNVVAS